MKIKQFMGDYNKCVEENLKLKEHNTKLTLSKRTIQHNLEIASKRLHMFMSLDSQKKMTSDSISNIMPRNAINEHSPSPEPETPVKSPTKDCDSGIGKGSPRLQQN